MKNKKILGIFDKRPLIWIHYVLLEIIILAFGYIVASYGNVTIKFFEMYSIFSIIGLYLIISISDQLIHKILGVD